jgi:hypothetical protein
MTYSSRTAWRDAMTEANVQEFAATYNTPRPASVDPTTRIAEAEKARAMALLSARM